MINLGAFARSAIQPSRLASGRAQACVHANHRIRKGCRPCFYLAHADGEPRIPLLSSHNLTRASSAGSTTLSGTRNGGTRYCRLLASNPRHRTVSQDTKSARRIHTHIWMAANDIRALTNSSLPGQVGARRSLQHVRTGSDFGLVWSGADSVERTAIETTNPPVCA